MSEAVKDLIAEHLRQALADDVSSHFAHLWAAVHAQDIEGGFPSAVIYAEAALELNPRFTQGTAILAILNCHLGDPTEHLEALQAAMAANKEDPQRFRHQRDLVVSLCLAERYDEAVTAARRMAEIAPDMCRNSLVAIAAMQLAGRPDDAAGYVGQILSRYPDLTRGNMRPVRVHDPARSAQFVNALREAGIPEG